MKKIIALVLSIVFAFLVVFIVSSCNESAKNTESSDFETTSKDAQETKEDTTTADVTETTFDASFDIRDGVLISYSGQQSEIVIPDGVKIIESNAFKNNTTIASVIVSKSVVVIRPNAFVGCDNLKSMVFEETTGWGVALNESDATFAIDVTIPVSNAVSARGNFSRFYWIREVEIETTETESETETTQVTTSVDETTEDISNLELIYLDNDYDGYEAISMGMSGYDVMMLLGGKPFEQEQNKYVYYTQNRNLFNAEYGTLTISLDNGKVNMVEYVVGKTIVYVRGTQNYYIITPGITEIGKGAFDKYFMLNSVTIPDSVLKIGESAFMDLKALGSVVIGDGVEVIGKDAFRGCEGLRAVFIYDVNFWCGIKFENLFSNPLGYAHNLYVNSNLVSDISIISPVTSISDFAFFNCYSIKDVTIHSLVTKIGQSAFFGCKNLKNVNFKTQSGWRIASTTAYDDGVTVDTTDSAQSAIFLSTAYMSYYWYNNGERDTTQRMKDDFDGYTGIKVGNSLDDIVNLVDSESYQYSLSNNSYIWYSEGYYEGDRYNVLVVGFENNKATSIMFVREGELVYCNTSATSVTIPNFVKTIGTSVFANNKALTEVILHDNVTTIGDSAFRNCSSLTNIVLGSGIEKIGDFAFEKCVSLAKIILPSRLEAIGRGAFSGTESLYWCDFENNKGWYATTVKDSPSDSENSVPVNVSYQGIVAGSLNNIYVNHYWYCSTPVIGHIKENYTGYKDIELGMTLSEVNSTIGFYNDMFANNIGFWYTDEYSQSSFDNTMLIVAFRNDVVAEVSFVKKGKLIYWDGNVSTVNITNRATSIGDNVFSGYDNIKNVIIPSSVSSIGNKAFYRCTNLVSVTIGNGVNKIAPNAFAGCTSLGTVTFIDIAGWHITENPQYASGIELDVNMPALNAFYLSGEYIQYYWYKA